MANRQIGFGKNFAPIKIRYGHFRGWNQIQILFPLEAEHIFSGLGKLSCAPSAFSVHNVGNVHFLIAVLLSVQIQHELGQRSMQPGHGSPHDDKS